MINTKGIVYEWDVLGAMLAIADDTQQAKFFEGFSKEMSSYDTNYQQQLQMASVNALLKEKTKEHLKDLFEQIIFKEVK